METADETIRALSERVSQLESDNRRMRRGALLLVGLLACGGAVGFSGAQQRVIEAEEFRLVRADGTRAGGLAIDSSGASLQLMERRGGIRAGLVVGANGSVFVLRDGTSARIIATAAGRGDAKVSLYAPDGSERASISQNDTVSGVALFGTGSGKRANLIATPVGSSVVLFDERGEIRSMVAADVKEGGTLLLLDRYGRPRN